MNYQRYRKQLPFIKDDRKWPARVLEKAPVWCSVDLRDGNQALIEPMVVEEKIEYFNKLVELGFKEIEVGFPSASAIEYDFMRQLIDRRLIPDDVSIQVLTQCRSHLLEQTLKSVDGIKNVIMHIYTSTSPLQRNLVYRKDKQQVTELAVAATRRVREFAETFPGNIILEYSTESFTETEPEYAVEICNAVIDAWQPDKERKIIINLPATIENSTPNVYADKVEWVSERLNCRENVVLSVHPHNDRGTGIASTELALLAGADRVEGTLFGNGERTGNVDIVTLACNMMAQGIDPQLDFSDIPSLRRFYERLIKLSIPERQPYVGELVFTAFSGGHQDAINKALEDRRLNNNEYWDIPYLTIDPADVGRIYEPIVRINSQSGGGGVAFIMETYHGFKLPKGMRSEFAAIIQNISEEEGELDADRIMWEFKKNYLDMKEPYHFLSCRMEDILAASDDNYHTVGEVTYSDHSVKKTFTAKGNGPIDAVKIGLQKELGRRLRILDYSEHALREGSNAQAAAYIHLMDSVSGKTTYGVGVSSSTVRASIRAIFSAVNRMERLS